MGSIKEEYTEEVEKRVYSLMLAFAQTPVFDLQNKLREFTGAFAEQEIQLKSLKTEIEILRKQIESNTPKKYNA